MTRFYNILAAATVSLSAAAATPISVTFTNTLPVDRTEMASLAADEILGRLDAPYAEVTDPSGNPVVCQVTHDGNLIFPVKVGAESSATYRIKASDCAVAADTVVWGRVYPERADDIAWENENVGFRIYGPATQRRGERAFGYDIFLKHPTAELIVPQLYAAQCSGENWHKVDSLRRIDPRLAKEFENTFTYHLDHGKGMDCYAVGTTLGDGVAVPFENDSLRFAWCYDTAEILDNGPIRFTVRLDFAPRTVGGCEGVVEHRLISLDADTRLNHARVWYEGLDRDITMAAGFPLRDDSAVAASPRLGTLAYADPTQGPDNGRAMLGLIIPAGQPDLRHVQGHVVETAPLAAGEKFDYHWGFAWDRADIATPAAWTDWLEARARALRSPLTVTIE